MSDETSQPVPPEPDSVLGRVLASASRLQAAVPDAVLVGGSAAALYAGHRESEDHDHVLADLADRFDMVLEALESTDGWVTNRVVPGKLILGSLGDIEAGVRQMIRLKPLETTRVRLASGEEVVVPPFAEILRVKAFLLVSRNQTRDYLDVAALTDRMGVAEAAQVIAGIDAYYADQHGAGDGVAAQCARQLAEPRPADRRVTAELSHYKRLKARWHDWKQTVAICHELADRMLDAA